MTPTLGGWYRVWRERDDAGWYEEGQLAELDLDSDECWLIGDDGEEIATTLSALEPVP
jgi:hypothetical protein